jgi:hypothetical protein
MMPSDAPLGHVLCLSPLNGEYSEMPTGLIPRESRGYIGQIVAAPEGVAVAEGTTLYCGVWHVAAEEDACGTIAFSSHTTIDIFLLVNLSLGASIPDCTAALVPGLAYCAVLHVAWDSLTKEDVSF